MRRAALITGGSRRIGAAICERLAREGYSLAIHGRDGAAAQSLAERLSAAGACCCVITGDLADASRLAPLINEAATAIGPLTLLVNNASVFEDDSIHRLDQWNAHFDVNLRAPLFLTQAFAAQLPTGAEGAVVNILDQKVLKPNPLFLSYSLSKAALHAATALLAQALAPSIRVNAVAPGPTLPSVHEGEAGLAREIAGTLLLRASPPEAVADAVAWLAGASSITGQTLAVDSGQHLAWQTPDITGLR